MHVLFLKLGLEAPVLLLRIPGGRQGCIGSSLPRSSTGSWRKIYSGQSGCDQGNEGPRAGGVWSVRVREAWGPFWVDVRKVCIRKHACTGAAPSSHWGPRRTACQLFVIKNLDKSPSSLTLRKQALGCFLSSAHHFSSPYSPLASPTSWQTRRLCLVPGRDTLRELTGGRQVGP